MFFKSDGTGIQTGSILMQITHRRGGLSFRKFNGTRLHPGQIPILCALSRQEEMSLRDLTEELHVKAPTITVSIQRLEKLEYVIRESDPADLRVKRIRLTEKGRSLITSIHDEMLYQESVLTRGFTGEEKQVLNGYLSRILENLVEEEQKTGNP